MLCQDCGTAPGDFIVGRNLYNRPASGARLRKPCTCGGRENVTLAPHFHTAATSICPFLPRPGSGVKAPDFTGDPQAQEELSSLAAGLV